MNDMIYTEKDTPTALFILATDLDEASKKREPLFCRYVPKSPTGGGRGGGGGFVGCFGPCVGPSGPAGFGGPRIQFAASAIFFTAYKAAKIGSLALLAAATTSIRYVVLLVLTEYLVLLGWRIRIGNSSTSASAAGTV
ncbi:hypothetical protein TrLO_g5256 [Triparma laevis f. longispina]|uniref:Uncharacterized protein n=1 Tax=Triparma laevis f. longispina TaxID=1714387 RepID=A0A9W7A7S9_9STRA|nr:hypothetical protein TrLO_g5256 [Triparma laevis f. longispina]